MCTIRLTFKIFKVRIINILHEFYGNGKLGVSPLKQERNTELAVTDVYFLETAAFARVLE